MLIAVVWITSRMCSTAYTGYILARIKFEVYEVIHAPWPSYLGSFACIWLSSRNLCRVGTGRLFQPSVHRSTVASRAFPIAGPSFGTLFRRRWRRL